MFAPPLRFDGVRSRSMMPSRVRECRHRCRCDLFHGLSMEALMRWASPSLFIPLFSLVCRLWYGMLQDGRMACHRQDRLTEMEFGGRRSLVTNGAAFDSSWRRSRDVVGHHATSSPSMPRHGLGGEAAGESVEDSTDGEWSAGAHLGGTPRRRRTVSVTSTSSSSISRMSVSASTYISTLRQLLTQRSIWCSTVPTPRGGGRRGAPR